MTLRIATSAIFAASTTRLNTLQGEMAKTQMQLSTNKRVLTAADDPIASARVLETTQSQSMNTQFVTNRTNAKTSLNSVDQALQDGTSLLQEVQSLTVQAANGTLSDSERGMLATEIEARMQDLMGVANTKDGTGAYLFAGYQSTTMPFQKTSAGVVYQGDQGQRVLQVGSARMMATTETGSSVFENIPTGNGSFQVTSNGANTGSAELDSSSVTDPSLLTHHPYQLAFSVSGTPAVTSYTVTDTKTGTAVASGPFTSGKQIAFDGIAMNVSGVPANGDTMDVAPSQKQSIFTTLNDLVATLRAPSDTNAGRATLSNRINAASANLSQALDNMLTVQASVGSRLKELDYLDSAGQSLDLQYQTSLSNLQDLDMAKTISLFTQQQQTLQAAQISFKTMSGLSLFNYIS